MLGQILPECRKYFEVEYDGDVYELCDKTEENRPVLALILTPLPF